MIFVSGALALAGEVGLVLSDLQKSQLPVLTHFEMPICLILLLRVLPDHRKKLLGRRILLLFHCEFLLRIIN